MLRTIITTATVLVCLAGAAFADVDLKLNGQNTKVGFVGSKPGGTHEGGFKKLSGTASYDGKDIATLKLKVDIDMTSLYSDNPKLTGHLKSPDFFGVKNFPKAKFVSTRIEKSDKGWKVTGNLTLVGKTNPLSFPAKIEAGDDGLSLTADFSIDRQDYGITFGKGKIDDQVKLTIKLRAKK